MKCYSCKAEYEPGPGRKRTCSDACALKIRGHRAQFPKVAHHLGSNPTQAPPVPFVGDALTYIETPPRERRVMCRRYEGCLDYAAGQDWAGWTCAKCNINEVITPAQAKRDMNGMADLMYEVLWIEEY